MKALLVGVALIVAACGAQPAPAPQNSVPYRLYTHCGIQYVNFEGKWYYADPPVKDWNGDSAKGRVPYDDGTMTRIDADSIVFTDPAGNRARFTTHPTYATPVIVGCD